MIVVLGLAAAAGVWKCLGRGKVFSRGAQGSTGEAGTDNWILV